MLLPAGWPPACMPRAWAPRQHAGSRPGGPSGAGLGLGGARAGIWALLGGLVLLMVGEKLPLLDW